MTSNGLKDAENPWNEHFFREFQNVDLKEMRSTPCIFLKMNLIVVCYVDDPVIFGRTAKATDEFKNAMRRKLKINDLGRHT